MANRTTKVGGIWAEGAPDVPISGLPTTGVTYANSNMTEADIQAAWPFKTIVDSADSNEMLRRLTTLMVMLELQGVLSWNSTTQYLTKALVVGSTGNLYIATQGTLGNDPVTDAGVHWVLYSSLYLAANGTAVNSALLGGATPGNASGNIPISNGTLCVNLNAEKLGGQPASYYDPVPVGTVFHMARSTPPTGYLAADGSQVSRAEYADLFSAIGTAFGVGNGSTTFNLPDLRGEFIRGWDTGGSLDPGRIFGTSQNDEVGAHVHPNTTPVLMADSMSGGDAHYYGLPGDSGSYGGAETRPHNVALLAVIKY